MRGGVWNLKISIIMGINISIVNVIYDVDISDIYRKCMQKKYIANLSSQLTVSLLVGETVRKSHYKWFAAYTVS